MNIDEAMQLQKLIAETHIHLGVSLKTVEQGDVYACYVEQKKYYLWSEEDWYRIMESQRDILYIYTEPGRAEVNTRMREGKERNKKRVSQVSIP